MCPLSPSHHGDDDGRVARQGSQTLPELWQAVVTIPVTHGLALTRSGITRRRFRARRKNGSLQLRICQLSHDPTTMFDWRWTSISQTVASDATGTRDILDGALSRTRVNVACIPTRQSHATHAPPVLE